MKFRFLLLLMLFSIVKAFSQNDNFRITYMHNVQLDTSRTLINGMALEAVLVGNRIESNYTFFRNFQKKVDSSSVPTIEQAITQKRSGTITTRIKGFPADSFGNQVYYNKKIDSVYLREKMYEEYIITREKTPKIKWTITDDTIRILGYLCKMAEADFRGRHYIAFFTPSIPIASGPSKFFGLPGLILQIQDDRNQVKISATKVEYPVSEAVEKFSGDGRLIKALEYVNIRDKQYEQTIRRVEQMVSGQENFDKTNLSSKIKKATGMYGLELKVD